MKKLICMFLSLATVLSLCACGKQEEEDTDTKKKSKKSDKQTEAAANSAPTTPFDDMMPTEPTIPVEPTDEEKDKIWEYYHTVQQLKITAEATLDKKGYSSDREYLQEQYAKLLEYGDMTKWANTTYATDLCENMDSEYFNPETDWNLQATLSDFTLVNDVILRYERITEDHLGNITEAFDATTWFYDAKGNAICISGAVNYAPIMLVDNAPILNGHREYDEAGRLIKITDYSYDQINSITTFSYDADGKLIKQEHKTNTTSWVIDDYTYDAEGRLLCASWQPMPNTLSDEIYEVVYSYNTDGTLAKEEKNVYDLTNAGERVIEKYFAMEYTYENGKLASAIYTEKHYSTISSWGKGVIDSRLSETYTENRTYTHDDQDRVVKEVVVPGDTIYYNSEGGVLQTYHPTVATYTYNTVYGDYIVYTPAD